jgi:hypothetical protein
MLRASLRAAARPPARAPAPPRRGAYLTGNKAGASGGGIYRANTTFSPFENIYSGNKAPTGPDVAP